MDFALLVVQLLGGVAGSSLIARRAKHLSLGGTGNVVTGVVGGGLGGQVVGGALGNPLIAASAGLNPGIVVSEIVSGAIGGVVLLILVAALHRALCR